LLLLLSGFELLDVVAKGPFGAYFRWQHSQMLSLSAVTYNFIMINAKKRAVSGQSNKLDYKNVLDVGKMSDSVLVTRKSYLFPPVNFFGQRDGLGFLP
jgi:hypothetical protein